MTARGLKVLLVTPNLEVGGAQENLRTMARCLPAAGCATVVCTFADGPLRAEIEQSGVCVEVLPSRRHSVFALPFFAVEMVRLRRRLVDIVRRHGIDLVQTRGLGTLDFLVMTLRLTRVVQVWWTIENVRFEVRDEHLGRHRWLLRPKRFAHRWCYRNGARFVDGIIVVSDETARAFNEAVGYRGDKVHVVANGADTDRFPAAIHRDDVRRRLGFGTDAHLMTMVGTFKRQKGHAYLVEAAEPVVARFPHLHVLLVGDGELTDTIAADVDARGLGANVHLLGTRRDVPELLAASDSFVLPSLWEGLPVALVEAMAGGLPVIATAVSGTSQVMIDGTTGWIVPPGDASSLAHAMIELLSSPTRAATMAAEARARVLAHFSAASQADLLAALFRRAAANDAPAGLHPATYGAAR